MKLTVRTPHYVIFYVVLVGLVSYLKLINLWTGLCIEMFFFFPKGEYRVLELFWGEK